MIILKYSCLPKINNIFEKKSWIGLILCNQHVLLAITRQKGGNTFCNQKHSLFQYFAGFRSVYLEFVDTSVHLLIIPFSSSEKIRRRNWQQTSSSTFLFHAAQTFINLNIKFIHRCKQYTNKDLIYVQHIKIPTAVKWYGLVLNLFCSVTIAPSIKYLVCNRQQQTSKGKIS